MTSETHHYRLGRLAARNISSGLDSEQEKDLLGVILIDSQFVYEPDIFTPVADFSVGYADELFERCQNPSKSERQKHADFFDKAKVMTLIGVCQRSASNKTSYKGPLEPSVD